MGAATWATMSDGGGLLRCFGSSPAGGCHVQFLRELPTSGVASSPSHTPPDALYTLKEAMSSPADSDDAFPHNYLSPSASYGMPGSTFLYASPLRSPEPFLFDLPIPSPKSRDLYSHLVWHASVVLADQVAAGEIEVAGKTVLELGCGLGLPGLVAARMGAKQVCT